MILYGDPIPDDPLQNIPIGEARYNNIPLSISGHDYPSMDLYIKGGFSETISLYTLGPIIDSNINLIITPNYNSGIPLIIAGKESYNSGVPLFIGKLNQDTKHTSLYINNDVFSIGGSGIGDGIELFLNPVSGASYGTIPLFLKSPNTFLDSGNLNAPIFLKVEEPILSSDGAIINSGIVTLFIESNNDANLYYKDNQDCSLFLPANNIQSGDMTIYLNRPIAETTTLNIRSFTPSKDMNVYISGNYIHNDNISLLIKAPEFNKFNFFLRGYLK